MFKILPCNGKKNSVTINVNIYEFQSFKVTYR